MFMCALLLLLCFDGCVVVIGADVGGVGVVVAVAGGWRYCCCRRGRGSCWR